MSWIQLIPDNASGGSHRNPPGGRFGKDGQLSINHAAADLLGEPDQVLIYAAENQPLLRIRPAGSPLGPSDRGAWTLTGGGHTQHRTKLAALIKSRPEMVGSFTATLAADGLHLVQQDHPVDAANLTWRQLLPSAGRPLGQRRTAPRSGGLGGAPQHIPAQLLPTGALALSGKPVELLGTPRRF